MIKGERKMPNNVDDIINVLLEEAGAQVAIPVNVDADDVVAWLAYNAGKKSKVLSADRDMFRYGLENAKERIFSGFFFNAAGKLLLKP